MNDVPTPITELIQASRALSEEKKVVFLEALPFLVQDELLELQKILEQERQTLGDIEAKANADRSATEQEFSQILDQAFKTQLRLATGEQEEAEKLQSEDILKKLDTV